MPSFAAAVTGLGLTTPAGIGVDQNWSHVLNAQPTAGFDPALAGLPVDFSCRVTGFEPDAILGEQRAQRLDRHQQLALVSAREAVADARLDPQAWDPTRVGVVVGTGTGGIATIEAQQARFAGHGPRKVSPLTLTMALPNMISGLLAMEFGSMGPNLTVSTACASGATAIGVARDLLRSGTADIIIAGGVDAAVTPLYVSAFTRMRALSRRRDAPSSASRPFDVARDGFVIAEGAGFLVLEDERHARARNAPVRAQVIGYGASADAHHTTAPHPDGAGVRQAVHAALTDAEVTPRDVQHINAHGTSTPLNDVTEARTIRSLFGNRVPVSSTKGVTGHTLGAAGAIEAAYTVLAAQHGAIPPTANLESPDPDIDVELVTEEPRCGPLNVVMSNSFGFGGQNAILIITAP